MEDPRMKHENVGKEYTSWTRSYWKPTNIRSNLSIFDNAVIHPCDNTENNDCNINNDNNINNNNIDQDLEKCGGSEKEYQIGQNTVDFSTKTTPGVTTMWSITNPNKMLLTPEPDLEV
eukprot:CAMPEP_0174818722 /NCGR_PEP_ID=MMETSP1107-20130205/1570_1 /TAXON_ID=36770 /ORGANISM="Paraphysomonas vestita, Strain GFlagA" /LENGTH=117 /DNA_ID=CAMNT_0016031015 /DNA_START=1031 /DNA_END=1384 /DNA_ORIENTATION=+